MEEKCSYALRFNTNVNEVASMTIQRGDNTLTGAQVESAMDAMLATGILSTKNGVPTSKLSAVKYTRQITDVPLS